VVGSLVCILDHNPLTNAEIAFLENPGNNFRVVRDGFLDSMESKGNPYDDFSRDWRKLLKNAKLDGEMESLDATEDWVNLVLTANKSEVEDAENLKLRGGTPDSKNFPYIVPNWNTEQYVQYWLGKQNEFKNNDTLTQAVAMANGIYITLGSEEVRQHVSKDSNDLLDFFREINEMQKARGYSQLENYPLEALLALAWRSNDFGRFGRVYYSLGGNACPGVDKNTFPNPANIHNFYEYRKRHMNLKDYRFNVVSIDTLKEMSKYVMNRWSRGSGKDFVVMTSYAIRNSPVAYGSEWIYARDRPGIPAPCENWVTIDGEVTRATNINNPNYVWQLFKTTGKGYGVSDDFNAFYDALIKSVGIAGVSLDYIWGPYKDNTENSHEETLYFDPKTNKWSTHFFGPLTNSMDVFIFRPPVIQLNYFNFYTPTTYTGYRNRFIPDLYHKIIGVNGSSINSQLKSGIPTKDLHSWFFTPT